MHYALDCTETNANASGPLLAMVILGINLDAIEIFNAMHKSLVETSKCTHKTSFFPTATRERAIAPKYILTELARYFL